MSSPAPVRSIVRGAMALLLVGAAILTSTREGFAPHQQQGSLRVPMSGGSLQVALGPVAPNGYLSPDRSGGSSSRGSSATHGSSPNEPRHRTPSPSPSPQPSQDPVQGLLSTIDSLPGPP